MVVHRKINVKNSFFPDVELDVDFGRGIGAIPCD